MTRSYRRRRSGAGTPRVQGPAKGPRTIVLPTVGGREPLGARPYMHDRWPFRGRVAAPRLRRPTGQARRVRADAAGLPAAPHRRHRLRSRVPRLGQPQQHRPDRRQLRGVERRPAERGRSGRRGDLQQLVTDDATATNCTPPAPLPPPTYTPDTALGSSATVAGHVQLQDHHADHLGDPRRPRHGVISAVFPIRKGRHRRPTGGGPAPVVAAHSRSTRRAGVAPQTITFTDTSSGSRTSTLISGISTATVISTRLAGNPPPMTYTVPEVPITRQLTVSNGVTPNTATKTITITTPPGPVADFTLDLSSPTAPSTVTFTNTSTGTTDPWAVEVRRWQPTSIRPRTRRRRSYHAGTWTVELTVDNALGILDDHQDLHDPSRRSRSAPCRTSRTCRQTSPTIQSSWTAAGFTTTVIFNPSRPPEYKIKKQYAKPGARSPCTDRDHGE